MRVNGSVRTSILQIRLKNNKHGHNVMDFKLEAFDRNNTLRAGNSRFCSSAQVQQFINRIPNNCNKLHMGNTILNILSGRIIPCIQMAGNHNDTGRSSNNNEIIISENS